MLNKISNLNLICLFINKNSLKFQFRLKLNVSTHTIFILYTIRSLDERFISSTDVQFVGHKCLYVLCCVDLKRIMAHWHTFCTIFDTNLGMFREWMKVFQGRDMYWINDSHPQRQLKHSFFTENPYPLLPPKKRHLRQCLECHFPLKIIPQIVMCAHQQVQAFCGNAPNFSGKLKTKTSLQIYPKWFWAFQQNIRSLILRHVTQTKRNGIYNTPYTLYLRRIFSHTVRFTSQIFALFNHAFRWKKFDLLYCREIVNLY